jgi:hypothetical protein
MPRHHGFPAPRFAHASPVHAAAVPATGVTGLHLVTSPTVTGSVLNATVAITPNDI